MLRLLSTRSAFAEALSDPLRLPAAYPPPSAAQPGAPPALPAGPDAPVLILEAFSKGVPVGATRADALLAAAAELLTARGQDSSVRESAEEESVATDVLSALANIAPSLWVRP